MPMARLKYTHLLFALLLDILGLRVCTILLIGLQVPSAQVVGRSVNTGCEAGLLTAGGHCERASRLITIWITRDVR